MVGIGKARWQIGRRDEIGLVLANEDADQLFEHLKRLTADNAIRLQPIQGLKLCTTRVVSEPKMPSASLRPPDVVIGMSNPKSTNAR